MKRMTQEEWATVLSNVGDDEVIEVTWLDGSDEWCLNIDCELLEDGFKSEKEAQSRLDCIYQDTTKAPTNQVIPLLAHLGKLGLSIDNDNRNFIIGSEAVEEVTNKWDEDRKYLIGSVPADNENLDFVEFDICFGVVERYNNRIPIGMYAPLHKLAESNNATKFIEYLRTLNDISDTYSNMADEVEDMLVAVVSELQGLVREIRDAGGSV